MSLSHNSQLTRICGRRRRRRRQRRRQRRRCTNRYKNIKSPPVYRGDLIIASYIPWVKHVGSVGQSIIIPVKSIPICT